MSNNTTQKKIENNSNFVNKSFIMENKKRIIKRKVNLEKDTWEVIKSYFNQNNGKELIRHQIDSFNAFMKNNIPNIITQSNPLVVYHEFHEEFNKYKYEIQIRFKNPYFTEAIVTENNGSSFRMTPNLARLRNFTYASPLHIDVEVKYIEKYDENFEKSSEKVTLLKNISIGKIPIMLNSELKKSIFSNRSFLIIKLLIATKYFFDKEL